MIDFDFKFRWFRLLYVGVISATIFFFYGWIPAALCMLTVIDINFDEDLFKVESSDEDDLVDLLNEDDRGYGPNS
jgi:hypothetical protein